MYAIVWQYRVHAEQTAAFERAYGADGDWVQLFRQGSGYLGTELFRSVGDAHAYLTVDRWQDRDAYAAFLEAHAAAYAALDAQCAPLCSEDARLASSG